MSVGCNLAAVTGELIVLRFSPLEPGESVLARVPPNRTKLVILPLREAHGMAPSGYNKVIRAFSTDMPSCSPASQLSLGVVLGAEPADTPNRCNSSL